MRLNPRLRRRQGAASPRVAARLTSRQSAASLAAHEERRELVEQRGDEGGVASPRAASRARVHRDQRHRRGKRIELWLRRRSSSDAPRPSASSAQRRRAMPGDRQRHKIKAPVLAELAQAAFESSRRWRRRRRPCPLRGPQARWRAAPRPTWASRQAGEKGGRDRFVGAVGRTDGDARGRRGPTTSAIARGATSSIVSSASRVT